VRKGEWLEVVVVAWRAKDWGMGACEISWVNKISTLYRYTLERLLHEESHCGAESLHTSGKSTQKALIFSPYRNAAKFSLKRPKLSFKS